MQVVTVFSTGRGAVDAVSAQIENLTLNADYLVLPPDAATGISDRRPIACTDVVVFGPVSHQ